MYLSKASTTIVKIDTDVEIEENNTDARHIKPPRGQ